MLGPVTSRIRLLGGELAVVGHEGLLAPESLDDRMPALDDREPAVPRELRAHQRLEDGHLGEARVKVELRDRGRGLRAAVGRAAELLEQLRVDPRLDLADALLGAEDLLLQLFQARESRNALRWRATASGSIRPGLPRGAPSPPRANSRRPGCSGRAGSRSRSACALPLRSRAGRPAPSRRRARSEASSSSASSRMAPPAEARTGGSAESVCFDPPRRDRWRRGYRRGSHAAAAPRTARPPRGRPGRPQPGKPTPRPLGGPPFRRDPRRSGARGPRRLRARAEGSAVRRRGATVPRRNPSAPRARRDRWRDARARP